AERVVDVGKVARIELRVDHGADHLDDVADLALARGDRRRLRGSRCHYFSPESYRLPVTSHPSATGNPSSYSRAAAPPTISAISCVIAACRARLYVRVRI